MYNVGHIELITNSTEQNPSWEAELPAFNGTWRFIIRFTTTCYW